MVAEFDEAAATLIAAASPSILALMARPAGGAHREWTTAPTSSASPALRAPVFEEPVEVLRRPKTSRKVAPAEKHVGGSMTTDYVSVGLNARIDATRARKNANSRPKPSTSSTTTTCAATAARSSCRRAGARRCLRSIPSCPTRKSVARVLATRPQYLDDQVITDDILDVIHEEQAEDVQTAPSRRSRRAIFAA